MLFQTRFLPGGCRCTSRGGLTPDGRRKQHERRKGSQTELVSYSDFSIGPVQGSTTIAPRWVYVVGIHAIGLALLFVVLHLTGVGPRVLLR